MSEKEEIIDFLRNISKDVVSGDPYPECEGQGTEAGCPDHQNCGLCRYEYMKNRGWLNDLDTQFKQLMTEENIKMMRESLLELLVKNDKDHADELDMEIFLEMIQTPLPQPDQLYQRFRVTLYAFVLAIEREFLRQIPDMDPGSAFTEGFLMGILFGRKCKVKLGPEFDDQI